MNHRIPNSIPAWNGARSLLVAGLLLASGAVSAVPLGSDITATGSVELCDGTNDLAECGAIAILDEGDVTQTGEVRTTVGGVTTAAPFDTTVAGDPPNPTTTPPAPNPLTGTLSDIDDGIGWSTGLSAGFESEFDFTIGFKIALANGSAADSFTVTIQVVFDHSVNAANVTDPNADGAYGQSHLDVELDNVDQVTSDIESDTFFGDFLNGTDLGTFGQLVEEAGTRTFDILLAPGATAMVAGTHQWEGGVFTDPEGNETDTLINLSADITIIDVVCSAGPCGQQPPPNVPEPATLALFGLGLSGLALRRRRRSAP